MKFMTILAILVATLVSQLSSAESDKEADLKKFGKLFQTNPKAAMNRLPPKYNVAGKRIQVPAKFPAAMIRDRSFVAAKNSLQSRPQNRRFRPFELASGQNDVSVFFPNDYQIVRNVENLDSVSHSMAVSPQPWSSDYWASYLGGTAFRYADPNSSRSEDFGQNYSNYQRTYGTVDWSNPAEIDLLSPAEKYDILVGDENFNLTRYSFNSAYQTYQSTGTVETWTGICHGWTPAAISLPRPTSAVTLHIPNFKGNSFDLTMYPDDLKALASLAWANGPPNQRFLGSRCDVKNPATDANGRIVDEACFDVNPGAWHMAVLNQMGLRGKSFVLDATYDYEVWNQPMASYSISYFDINNFQAAGSLNDAIVTRTNVNNDKFSAYRAPQTTYLVGVAMTINYVAETAPDHTPTDDPGNDRLVAVQYYYDLELDAEGNIVGGEWYQNAHPDFAWVPEEDESSSSVGDSGVNLNGPLTAKLSANLTPYAVYGSQNGQPLTAVIQSLFQQSSAK